MMHDLGKAWDSITNPSKNTQKFANTSDVLSFYYRASILPLFATMAIVLVTIIASPALSLTDYIAFAISQAAGILVLLPIYIVVFAAVIHFLAKVLFKWLKGSYENTVAAVMFGTLPSLLFFWLGLIPKIALPSSYVLYLWNLAVLTVSLSKQHKVSTMYAALSWGISLIVIFVLVIVLVVATHAR